MILYRVHLDLGENQTWFLEWGSKRMSEEMSRIVREKFNRDLGFEIMDYEIHVKIIFLPRCKNIGKRKFLARIIKVIE